MNTCKSSGDGNYQDQVGISQRVFVLRVAVRFVLTKPSNKVYPAELKNGTVIASNMVLDK